MRLRDRVREVAGRAGPAPVRERGVLGAVREQRRLLHERDGATAGDGRRSDAAGARPAVIVATRVYTPEPVAAAFREEALAHALADAGADVTVLTTRDPAASGRETPHPGVRVSRAPVKRDRQGQVRGYVSYLSFDIPLALRLLGQRRLDAIVSEPPPTTGGVVMVLAAIRRVPFVFYAADVWSDATDSVGGVPAPIRLAVRLAETTVWRRAARVLTISPGVDDRVRLLTRSRVRTAMIGNGIDTETFRPDGPDAGEAGPYFVYAGTVSEWQGADVFVEAFARVRASHPGVRLLFFSEGTGRDALAELVRELGVEGVELRDKVAPSRVAEFLRGAVAGLSSITPGQGYEFALPTKVYAATACGTPVIHAGEGAAHDRVASGSLGWACAHDAGEVAAAMVSALEGDSVPDGGHLRSWTLEHASLAGCAAKGAQQVLATLRV